jgi:predicted Zn-dependent protease
VDFLEGALALEQNRPQDARRKLEALRRRGLVSYDIELRLALAALALREAEPALVHLRAAAGLAPGSVEARSLLAEHLGALERDEERLAVETEVFRLEPQTATLAKRVVLEHARAGHTALAAELAGAALFIDPDDPDLHAARGRALLAMGKTEEGARALEQALLFQPGDPRSIHRLLVGAYQKLGAPDKIGRHRQGAAGADAARD